MKKKYIGISLMLTATVLMLGAIWGWVYGAAVHSGDYTKAGIIRLHVLANSDLDADQVLKRQVRDEILKYLQPYMQNMVSREDAEMLLTAHMAEIQAVAGKVVRDNGCAYPVRLELGEYAFPTKLYGGLALPAGHYQALRILIGEAKGQNWWCVLFPPLCFIDITNATAVSEQTKQITEEINQQQQQPELKFKIVELFQQLK